MIPAADPLVYVHSVALGIIAMPAIRARAVANIFCTLSDILHLPQVMALYSSMERHCGTFMLYYLPLDIESEQYVRSIEPKRMRLVLPCVLEPKEEIRRARVSRQWRHYCWMMASILVRNLLIPGAGNHLWYLDADCWFMSSPTPVTNRLKGKSVAATPHRFPPRYERYIDRGRFCQCATWFRHNTEGDACSNHWAEQCISQCDDASMGDQLYLNEWPERMGKQFYEIATPRWGLGPWNMLDSYDFAKQPILVHFHEFGRGTHGRNMMDGYKLTDYPLSPQAITQLYEPYLHEVDRFRREIGLP